LELVELVEPGGHMRIGPVACSLGCALALALPTAAAAEDPPLVNWATLLPSLTTGYEPSSENDCKAGRTQCVDAVIREMTRRFDRLAQRCDHNAVFSLTYLRTTEEYRRAIDDPTFFEDTPWVNHYDAVFGRYYFDAYDDWAAGRRAEVPKAWLIAFDAARNRQVSGTGNLVLGMSAHINRDLPYVLAGIGLVKPDGTTRKTDHDKVNQFLNRVSDDVLPEVARRLDPTVDDQAAPGWIDDIASFQAIPGMRETAWRHAEMLVTAPTPAARALVETEIETYAATVATSIKTATVYPPLLGGAAKRDVYCASHWDDG
jgi:hypothetical protein